MKPVLESDLRHWARLAGLEISDAEIQTWMPVVQKMISYFQQLAAVKTEGVQPLFHFQEELALQEDRASDENSERERNRAAIFEAAGSDRIENRTFRVSRIVE